jgi:drug/metabolite transporter (DMT)-like permease
MAVLLGVLVAASFGSGDFLGGRASRRAPTLTVLMAAQTTAVLGAIVVCVFVSARVEPHDIVFGALAGSVSIVGIGLLYHGLSVGRMGVVAPLTALVASSLPVAWGVANGERPSAVVILGVVLAVIAGVLISRQEEGEAQAGMPAASGIAWSVGAGVCLGTSLILYFQTSTDSGLWPVLAARATSFVLVAIVLVVVAARRTPIAFPTGPDRVLALGAGVLDVTASSLLLLAVRQGLLVVVSPLAALAPAATVVLARFVLGERLHFVQRIGFGFAVAGLVLIVVG